MKDHILHSGLFNTVKEIKTASCYSLHVKGGSCLSCKSKKTKKTIEAWSERYTSAYLSWSLCLYIYYERSKPLLTNIFLYK